MAEQATGEVARWVAGMTDAEVGRLIATATRYGLGLNSKDKFSEAATAFRAALLALVPKEDAPSGPWKAALDETLAPRAIDEKWGWEPWLVYRMGRVVFHARGEAEALAVRDALNALPPSPGATP